MLPSTGYFKAITCPFYDSGSCERPYCHFKHVRRDDGSNPAPLILGSSINNDDEKTACSAKGSEKKSETTSVSIERPNSEIIQQLVSDAVSKALADQGVVDSESVSKNIVSKVVEGLKPTLSSSGGKHSGVPQSIIKPPCVYNPTPISELKKRHIAVPVYNPTRESKVAVKRKSTEDSAKPWLSALPESVKTDYTKKTNHLTYKPTAIVHESLNYVPTAKSDDSNSSDYAKRNKDFYYPKSKKRREEYVPKNVKTPLKNNFDQLDEITLDSFDPEFNLLDDILIGKPKDDADSQDFYNVEGKFSDEETIEVEKNIEIDKNLEEETDQQLTIEDAKLEKINETSDTTTIPSMSSESSNSHTEKNEKESAKERLNSDNKNHSRRKYSSTDKDNKRESSHSNNKEPKDTKKHSTSKTMEHKSSLSKHSSKHKSHHKDKSSSSHRHSSSNNNNNNNNSSSSSSHTGSRSKSQRSSSSHREKSDSKENHHHKTSRHHKREKSSSSRHSKGKNSNSHSEDSKKLNNTSNEGKIPDDESDNENYSFINTDELLATSDSEHDVEEECLKIFQEYQVPDPQSAVNPKEQEPSPKEEKVEDVGGKKRVAHPSAATSVVRNIGLPSQLTKKLNPNPQQRMYERWRLMRKTDVAQSPEDSSNHSTNVNIEVNNSSSIGENHHSNGRIRRIAHVPYAMSLAMSKKKVVEATSKPVESKTVAQTTTKGTARVAHVPQTVPSLVRPEPLNVATQKFPLNVRQYYVNMMQDICIQIYTSGEDAAQRALREEYSCHERCKALAVYKNSCMLAAHRLRKEVDQNEGGPPAAMGIVSHDAVLTGKTKGSWSVVKVKKAETNFKGSAFYFMLKKWIMTEQQLKDNGFPRPHPSGPKGRAKIYAIRNQPQLSKVPNQRICCRCGQAYMVDKQGLALQEQNCIYHWGRKFTVRGEGKYSCCQQYGSAGGCSDAKNHVWDFVDYDNLRGYVKTLPKDLLPEEQGVYALDCEMCYTTQGLELTRLTVINEDSNVIYETLVKPDNPIVDYNTRFSGITEKDMLGVSTTLLDVQATLLTMFSEHTILVGHSLESDFKALKLIHNTVVDTSMVFPHKNGPPHKRALKNLCSEYLRKIIQNDVGGHDSNEDAVACMELIHWKVREEAKLQ